LVNFRQSFLRISESPEFSSLDYHMWAYPDLAAQEIGLLPQPDGVLGFFPDLVFLKGYVRRRLSRELHLSVFRGDRFYEVSEVGGACCSGAPLISARTLGGSTWRVFGVYIGEETSHRHVGYAVRSEAFCHWVPDMLGHSVLDECRGGGADT
jgi:hypothetical protein